MYSNGVIVVGKREQDVPRDRKKAIEWYLKAANSGDMDAQKSLGDLYWVLGDKKKSKEWYQRAAEQGCTYSRGQLILFPQVKTIC